MVASKKIGGASFGLSLTLGVLSFVAIIIPFWFDKTFPDDRLFLSLFLACVERSGSSVCASIEHEFILGAVARVAQIALGLSLTLGLISFILHLVWLCSSSPKKGVTVAASALVLTQGLLGIVGFIQFGIAFGFPNTNWASWASVVISFLLVIIGSIYVHITSKAPEDPPTQGTVLAVFQTQTGYPNQPATNPQQYGHPNQNYQPDHSAQAHLKS
jgi:hypothetical protein